VRTTSHCLLPTTSMHVNRSFPRVVVVEAKKWQIMERELGRRYVLSLTGAATLSSLCASNEQVAKDSSRLDLSQFWRVLGSIFGTGGNFGNVSSFDFLPFLQLICSLFGHQVCGTLSQLVLSKLIFVTTKRQEISKLLPCFLVFSPSTGVL
jgi:hypothetical protein